MKLGHVGKGVHGMCQGWRKRGMGQRPGLRTDFLPLPFTRVEPLKFILVFKVVIKAYLSSRIIDIWYLIVVSLTYNF